jgi:2-methylaconitate cis-trans-isomerase PrpF
LSESRGGTVNVLRAGVIRTARVLFSGEICVPKSVWDGRKAAATLADVANA